MVVVLPAPVRAEKAEDLAGARLERYALERGDTRVALAEIDGANHARFLARERRRLTLPSRRGGVRLEYVPSVHRLCT